MIASFGGLTIDRNGNRDYPGSGGMVGGLSEPGKNYGYILGAGAEYNRFTPMRNRDPRDIDPCELDPGGCSGGGGGGGGCDCGDCVNGCGGPILCSDGTQPPCDTGGGGGGGMVCPGDPACPPPPTDPSCPGGPGCPTITPGGGGVTLQGLIGRLLGATPLNNSGPVYLFTPQPGEVAAAGGLDMKNLAIIGVIGLIAWFAYSKLS